MQKLTDDYKRTLEGLKKVSLNDFLTNFKTFKLKYKQFETQFIINELELNEPLSLGHTLKRMIFVLMNQEQENHKKYMDHIKEESENRAFLERQREKREKELTAKQDDFINLEGER